METGRPFCKTLAARGANEGSSGFAALPQVEKGKATRERPVQMVGQQVKLWGPPAARWMLAITASSWKGFVM